jgi:hypothetical protein
MCQALLKVLYMLNGLKWSHKGSMDLPLPFYKWGYRSTEQVSSLQEGN